MRFKKSDESEKVIFGLKNIYKAQQQYVSRKNIQDPLALKNILTKAKSKANISKFIDILKVHTNHLQPIGFTVQNQDQINENRFIKIKGWRIDHRVEAFIMTGDIIMTICMLIISGFQAFIDDFRQTDATSTSVYIIKSVAIIFFVLRLILLVISIEFDGQKEYIYITDIIWKEIKQMGLFLEVGSIIINAMVMASPTNDIFGAIYFAYSVAKLPKLYKNLKTIQIFYINNNRKQNIWNLLKIIIFNLLLAHFISCMLLSLLNLNKQKNWYLNSGLDPNFRWHDQYMLTFYLSCTIMLTIGFGDIIPSKQNPQQAFLFALIQVFSVIILAFNISEMANAISNIRSAHQEMSKKVGIVRRMCKEVVSIDLQTKIQGHIAQQIKIKENYEFDKQKELLLTLPEQLRNQFYEQSNEKFMRQMPFFKYLQPKTLITLIESFKDRIVYCGGDYLVKSHKGSTILTIVKFGMVGLQYWRTGSKMNGVIIQTIKVENRKKPALLNSSILFKTHSVNFNVISLSQCHVLEIQSEKFIEIIKESEMDSGYFFSMRDKCFYESSPLENIYCPFCNKNHTKFVCSRLHFTPIKNFVYLRHIQDKNSPRNKNIKMRRQKKLSYTAYFLRKKIFTAYQDMIGIPTMKRISNQGDSDERNIVKTEPELDCQFNVDQPHNYLSYFAPCNPRNLKYTPTRFETQKYKRIPSNTSAQIQLFDTGYDKYEELTHENLV